MADRVPVYVFRAPNFAPAGDTLVSAAPREAVVKIYGRGGLFHSGGLAKAFGGVAVYRAGLPMCGRYHFAIWGNRKASRFRNALRQGGLDVEIIKAPPPGRLVLWSTK